MLRIVFLLLLLANAGYYLWSHGHLAGLGLAPVLQSEPQRLEEQIKPEALSFDKPGAAEPQESTAAEPEPAEPAPEAPAKPVNKPESKPEPVAAAKELKEPESCYQASGIEERQADSIRRALAAKPKADWELVASHQNGRWMVYMGKFPDTEFLDRKRGELRLMNIDFDRAGGGFEPGLSLGRFSTEEAAQRQLATFTRQGVRTARVVQERPELTTYALRLPKATPSFRNEVAALAGKNLLPKALQACPK
jgi:hypothetical protein